MKNVGHPYLEIHTTNNPLISQAHVILPQAIIDNMYREAIRAQQHNTKPQGFGDNGTPLNYIDNHYKSQIIDHLKEYLLRYMAVGKLYQGLREKKVITIGEPRLKTIELAPHQDARYIFDFTPAQEANPVRDWKFLPFKAPVRKKYKDIDKQAETFLSTELEQDKLITGDVPTVKTGDWICFTVQLVDADDKPVLTDHLETLWLKIGDSETCISYQELFIGKKLDEEFITTHECIQEYLSAKLDTLYRYRITIKEVMPQQQLSIEDFKHHFKLKSNRKVQQKLIEVFSFRNDISLRRLMVEEAFRVLLKTYPQSIPHAATLRQQKIVLDLLQHNPDYMVYKKQPDFLDKVAMLAEKQIKEMLLIDHFAFQENISIHDEDVRYYLNLTKRPRTKEFIYFQHGALRANDEESPISDESLKQACLREKTLNHILFHLCKA